MWAIFLDGYTYHAQAPNMRFYGDKEKRDGIRDSKTHRIFSWTMTWEDIQLFENDKEDSLGLNSITRLIEFLKILRWDISEKPLLDVSPMQKTLWDMEVHFIKVK